MQMKSSCKLPPGFFERERINSLTHNTLLSSRAYFMQMKSTYKLPPGFLERERSNSPMRDMFPSGLQSGNGPMSRHSSRAMSREHTQRNQVHTPSKMGTLVLNPLGYRELLPSFACSGFVPHLALRAVSLEKCEINVCDALQERMPYAE